ncbi:MAG: glycerophosphodiester phosphodiesterase [Nitrososphaeria archaeon]
MGVLLFGHRGARGLAPENTLPSFRTAVEYGVDGVELDVHLSKDGEVIVMHDDRVDRTTNGSGYIKDLTSAEIKALDAGIKFSEKFRGTKVPLLEEVLKEFGSRILYKIEIKHSSKIYPGIEEKVVDIIERMNLVDRAQVISFDFDSLQAVKELNPRINTGIIIEGRPHWFIDVAKRLNASWVHAFSGLVYDSDDVKKLHEEGLKLGVWTINDRESIIRFCNMGVDDITSDYPNLLVQLCKKA